MVFIGEETYLKTWVIYLRIIRGAGIAPSSFNNYLRLTYLLIIKMYQYIYSTNNNLNNHLIITYLLIA